jgi:glycine cleavage system H lipoate-binding protein
MVALYVVAVILAFLTLDLVVQRFELRRATARNRVPAQPIAELAPRIAPAVALTVPVGAYLDPGHAWVEVVPGGSVHVGLDPLPALLLGTPDGLDALVPGSHVLRGQPLLTLRRGARLLTVRSPVSGEVLDIHAKALAQPAMLGPVTTQNPWLFKIKTNDLEPSTMHVGAAATAWLGDEMGRLRDSVTRMADAHSPVGATLHDGGVPAEAMAGQLDDTSWQSLVDDLFAANPQAPTSRPEARADVLRHRA